MVVAVGLALVLVVSAIVLGVMIYWQGKRLDDVRQIRAAVSALVADQKNTDELLTSMMKRDAVRTSRKKKEETPPADDETVPVPSELDRDALVARFDAQQRGNA